MSDPTFTLGNSDSITGAASAAPGDLIKDTTTAGFEADVIAASKDQPILVDFWAPWCGPCKQLTPILEKAVIQARGKVKLVKMNIDEHPEISGQLGIQSIPAVIAFKNGQPLDGFMGAQQESQVNAFIERVAGPVGPSDGEALVARGDDARAAGDTTQAAQYYAAALKLEAGNVLAIVGLALCCVDEGDLQQAGEILARVPADSADDAAVAAARAAIDLAAQAETLGDLADLEASVEADPGDHAARFELAIALNARDEREAAVDQLLEIVGQNRGWNDEAARKQLLQFFEAWGPTHEMTGYGRRRLSSLLFS